MPKNSHNGVIVAVPFTGHTLRDATFFKGMMIWSHLVVSALIRMNKEFIFFC